MLQAHEPDERGDCPTCSTRWHKCKAPARYGRSRTSTWSPHGLAPQQTAASQDHRREARRRVPGQSRVSAAETTGRHALVNPRRPITA